MLIGSNIHSTTNSSTQTLNWSDSEMNNTLHRQLMTVESIYTKAVIKATGNTEFKDAMKAAQNLKH